jgi:hypothetical protein
MLSKSDVSWGGLKRVNNSIRQEVSTSAETGFRCVRRENEARQVKRKGRLGIYSF